MSTSVAGLSTNFFPSAENGFTSTTSGSVASGAVTVGLNSVAGYTNGEVVVFVIDPTDATKKQTFTGVIDTAGSQVTSVVWTAGTNQTHALGATVVDYATATHISMMTKGITQSLNQDGSLITQAVRDALNLDSGSSDGWTPFGYSLTSITALGNRSYTAVVSGVDTTGTTSVGMRLKLPRTVTAPTQCTSLNGTTQYYSKTSPTGISFTTTFTCSAWIKLDSYQTVGGIINRQNADTEGWSFRLADGRVSLLGLRIAGNNKSISSYQSIPLNKWVHVAATLDMSAGDTTAQKIWIDGVEVPRAYGINGTATALVQGTTALVVGATRSDGSLPLDGKIAQAAVFSSQLADATIKAMMNQTMTGSESGLVSAYTFNNSINDLSANANNLTANGGALATNADTPFTNAVTGTSVTAGTTNYGIIMAQTFSTNTTYTIQIPEGETLPTTGGIGTVSYSTQKTPYGFPGQRDKWNIEAILNGYRSITFSGANWTTATGTITFSIPVGTWDFGYRGPVERSDTIANQCDLRIGMSTSAPNPSDYNLVSGITNTAANTYTGGVMSVRTSATFSTATVYTLINYIETGTSVSAWFPSAANKGYFRFYAENGLL